MQNKHNLKKFTLESARSTAEHLIESLNGIEQRSLDEQEPLRQIDCLLTWLAELNRRSVFGEPIHPDDLKPVNEILARFKWITQWVLTSGGILYPQNEMADVDPTWHSAGWLSSMVVDVIEHDLLDLIRRCDYCQRYYLAKRREWRANNFCKTEHQLAYWRARPDVKEKRKKWQKKYYKDYLSPVTRKSSKKRRAK
jgi:hypothetical protein